MNNFMNLNAGNPAYRGILPGQKKYAISSNVQGAVVTDPFQPYNTPPWNYTGTEGQNDAPPWYYAPGSTDPAGDPDYAVYHPDVVDWVLVRFRTGNFGPNFNSSIVEKTAAALLFKDGTIRFLDDCILPAGSLSSNLVYIQVDHRNHMAVLTPEKVQITNYTLSWDFRTEDSYRTPIHPGQKNINPGVWVAFAGDGDQISDYPFYDVLGLDNIIWSSKYGSYDLYLPGDFNMNSDVNGIDQIYFFGNNGLSNWVPKN